MLRVFSLGLLLVSSAHAGIACSTFWANGFPEAGNTHGTDQCEPFLPLLTTLTSGQEMFTMGASGEDPVVKQHMEWAAEAFSYSSSKYSAFASVPKIRLVWSERPYPGDAASGNVTRAVTYVQFFSLGAEFCPVVVYPSATGLSKEHFFQTIAHEIYHCVQKVEFPDASAAAVTGASEGLFWYESIAQYMSNDVYPTYEFEYSRMFGVYDSHLPFFQQSTPYLSEGFFQGLFWQRGSRAQSVHNLQAGFGGAGRSATDDVLSIPEISEVFHRYARDHAFDELLDTAGHKAPWPRPERQAILVPEAPTSTFTVSFMDFATEPFEITFPKKGRWRVNIRRRSDGAKLSVRKRGETAWRDSFDTSFVTECESERTFEGIFTRASDELAMNGITFDIERTDNEECPCDYETPPTDICLFGEWQVQLNDVRDFLGRMMGPAFEMQGASGGLKLTFTPDGQHSWDYQNLHVQALQRTRKPMLLNMYWNGVHHLKYSNLTPLPGRGKVCARAVGGGVQGHATGTVEGRTFGLPMPVSMISGQGEIPYHCSADAFGYSIQAGPYPVNWVFRRASR